MKFPRSYRAFGLSILSEIEMHHWTEGAAPRDVSIDWGNVPLTLPDAVCLSGVCWARPGACLLNYAGVGRLLAESGRRITVAQEAGDDPTMLRTLISATGMAALLYQRGQICLHASAVAKDGRAVLFVGHSGAGKSTLASALLQRGCDFISDDICVIQSGPGGQFDVLQSFPSLRLCQDALLELELGGQPRTIDPWDDKRRLRPEVKGSAARAVVTRICLLETGPVAAPALTPIRGVERVQLIQQQLFRPRLARIVGDPDHLLEISVGLGRQVDVCRLVRPPAGFQLDELCALAIP